MKSANKIEREKFKSLVVNEMEKLGTADIWLAVVSLFSDHEEPYMLYLKSDLPILEKLAEGFSVASIANSFAIPSKDIIEVSNVWGMTPLDFTLDFNPLLVYNKGMTLDIFRQRINEYLPVPLGWETAKIVLINVRRYHEILDFVNEEETS